VNEKEYQIITIGGCSVLEYDTRLLNGGCSENEPFQRFSPGEIKTSRKRRQKRQAHNIAQPTPQLARCYVCMLGVDTWDWQFFRHDSRCHKMCY
jgi:hypothetical protein